MLIVKSRQELLDKVAFVFLILQQTVQVATRSRLAILADQVAARHLLGIVRRHRVLLVGECDAAGNGTADFERFAQSL